VPGSFPLAFAQLRPEQSPGCLWLSKLSRRGADCRWTLTDSNLTIAALWVALTVQRAVLAALCFGSA